jgi:hypothetical protein
MTATSFDWLSGVLGKKEDRVFQFAKDGMFQEVSRKA